LKIENHDRRPRRRPFAGGGGEGELSCREGIGYRGCHCGEIREFGFSDKRVSVYNADEKIEGSDDPVSAVRTKKDSSIAVGLRLLKEGTGDAFVSAGNTGALLVGSTLIVRTLPGIRRGALATPLPTARGFSLLLDSGANVECSGDSLFHFGVMGCAYMERVMGISSPKIGLLNVGTEEIKGTDAEREAVKLLKASGLNFIGNIEGRDVANGVCDVIVTDGFTGNVLLKSVEGYGMFFFGAMKKVFKKNLLTKFAALAVKDGLLEFKSKMDYEEYGGAPILGIAAPVFKAHGSSDAKAFKNAIRAAASFIRGGVNEKITEVIENAKQREGQ